MKKQPAVLEKAKVESSSSDDDSSSDEVLVASASLHVSSSLE